MRKIPKRIKLYGFDISIENPKGSIRRWYDPHGKESGSTKMKFDYGYIRQTKGTDGDHVDVYIGPNSESQKVFIVDQMKKPDDGAEKWTKFDEQKCMLAFSSADEAKAAYLKQYDDPRFFGGMKAMSIDEFREKVLHKDNHGKKVASVESLRAFGREMEKVAIPLRRVRLTDSSHLGMYFRPHEVAALPTLREAAAGKPALIALKSKEDIKPLLTALQGEPELLEQYSKAFEKGTARHELTHYLRDRAGKMKGVGEPGLRNVLRTVREEAIANFEGVKPFEKLGPQAHLEASKRLGPSIAGSVQHAYAPQGGVMNAALGGSLKPFQSLAKRFGLVK